MKRATGFVLLDAVMGLTIVTVLIAGFAMAAGQTERASRQLAQTRAASHLAEEILGDLQSGTTLPPQSANQQFQIISLAAAQSVPGWKWCKVAATDHGRTTTLIGMVPAKAVPQ